MCFCLDLLQANGANENDYRAIVKTGPYGPELVSKYARAEYIRSCFKTSLQPIGKLIPKVRPEEVSVFNGGNGLPPWVTAGSFAFDLTRKSNTQSGNLATTYMPIDFPFSSHEEEQLLSKSAGGPIQTALSAKNPASKDLMNRLQPHLCAIVESGRLETHFSDQKFTPRMLRWRDNPELRCYMAIRGVVYDMEGKHIFITHKSLEFLYLHPLQPTLGSTQAVISLCEDTWDLMPPKNS